LCDELVILPQLEKERTAMFNEAMAMFKDKKYDQVRN
jgi:hypothetical protein